MVISLVLGAFPGDSIDRCYALAMCKRNIDTLISHNWENVSWIHYQVNDPTSPLFGFKESTIKEACSNLASGKVLAQTCNVYPITLRDVKIVGAGRHPWTLPPNLHYTRNAPAWCNGDWEDPSLQTLWRWLPHRCGTLDWVATTSPNSRQSTTSITSGQSRPPRGARSSLTTVSSMLSPSPTSKASLTRAQSTSSVKPGGVLPRSSSTSTGLHARISLTPRASPRFCGT